MTIDPWVTIIIVAYNNGAELQRCVAALGDQSDQDFRLVVVDNNQDENAHPLPRLPALRNLTVLRPERNLGFAGGCNFGAKGAMTPWLVTLNPDTVATPSWLAALKTSIERRPETQMWASTLLTAENPEMLDGFGDVLSIFGIAWRGGFHQPLSEAPVDDVCVFGPCGAAAAYQRNTFEKLGGFDEDFFCYLEDVDLAARINLVGGDARISRSAVVHHIGGASSAAAPDFAIYHSYKNNLYMLVKCAPVLLAPFIISLYAVVQCWVLWRNRGDGRHSARMKGLRAAVKRLPKALRARRGAAHTRLWSGDFWRKLCKSYPKFRRKALYYWR